MKSRLSFVAGLLALLAALLLGAGLGAQQVDEDNGEDSSAAAETTTGQSLSSEEDTAAEEAAAGNQDKDKAEAKPPAKASTDVFIPTEEVSFDKSVSMPVDI